MLAIHDQGTPLCDGLTRGEWLRVGGLGALGLSLPGLLAGAAITEFIFSWPGLGQLGLQAVQNRDYPVVLAFVMMGGIAVVIGNLLADILYGVVDPRIKY